MFIFNGLFRIETNVRYRSVKNCFVEKWTVLKCNVFIFMCDVVNRGELSWDLLYSIGVTWNEMQCFIFAVALWVELTSVGVTCNVRMYGVMNRDDSTWNEMFYIIFKLMCSVLMWADVSRNEIYWPEMKCNVYIQEERRKDEIWFVLFWDEMQWNVMFKIIFNPCCEVWRCGLSWWEKSWNEMLCIKLIIRYSLLRRRYPSSAHIPCNPRWWTDMSKSW